MTGHLPARGRRGAVAWLGASLAAAALPLATLSGCGFTLRRPPELPFRRVALAGFSATSALAAELRRQLASTTQVVEAPAQAEVVLHALTDSHERSVVGSTAAGQVRELTLRVRFHFRLATPGERELIPATELLLERDLTYSETVALAKVQEEAELVADMRADIVQQVLRRLARASVTAPAAPGAASAPPAASGAAPAGR